MFAITQAKRKAVPMLISLAGVSGSGKTYSALLLAAGLAGPGGKVGFLDTENGRGSMYADSPGIKTALPQGYDIAEMREPFSPARYSEAVEAFEKYGCKVLVIDSMTHEWEGYGGCADIAENNKLRGMPNWAKAKMEHKRMMNQLLASPMHLIFCLRAREKVKIAKVLKDGREREEVIPIGLQPIQEKNFTFEMTLSLLLDEHTHRPQVTKCPEPLMPLFQTDQRLITKAMGERLREWASAGAAAEVDPEALLVQARTYAAQGTAAYAEFWKGLAGKQQNQIGVAEHDKNKALARMADDRARAEDAEPSILGAEPASMLYESENGKD
jgi:hypothetical protein